LPDLAKSLGRALGEFKRATSDLKQSIETETGLDEVRGTLDEVKKDIKSQVDLTDPKPAEPATPSSGQADSDSPLGKVKAAFDEMNADTLAPSASDTEPAPEAESDPPVDPDQKSPGKSVP
jgi:Sec-independent protein translocase protein TatA